MNCIEIIIVNELDCDYIYVEEINVLFLKEAPESEYTYKPCTP